MRALKSSPGYTAIVPTLNAAGSIDALIGALKGQTLPPEVIWVIDSQSDDGTARLARAHEGVRVTEIARRDFDHGGTRDMALCACETPFAVLLTQDALPAGDNCMAALLSPFEDERVAAVCARQVAYPHASARERAVREFRYGPVSRVWTAADLPALGIRAYLLSDACAAYRLSAYQAVGGFAHPIATNEDMLIAADFLRQGYALAYQAEARVWHSHDLSLAEEYRRNRKIGAFLARYGERFQGGGDKLRAKGVRVESLARIVKMDDNDIQFG